jgi:hypothetical protein
MILTPGVKPMKSGEKRPVSAGSGCILVACFAGAGQRPCGNLKRLSGLTLIYYGSLAPMMYQVRS